MPDTITKRNEAIANWMLNEHTGRSSMTVAGVLLGGTPSEPRHPYDPDDFSRIYTLVNMIPDGVALFKLKMRGVDEHWKNIVEHWEEMVILYEEETPTGRAPKLYKLMKDLGL